MKNAGYDLMSFMSEMVRPDQYEEREDEATTKRSDLAGLTPDERNLIGLFEWDYGRKLTPQQINNALRQAPEIGEL